MPNIASWRSSFETVSHPFLEGALIGADSQPLFPFGLLVDAQFWIPASIAGPVRLIETRSSGVRLELVFGAGSVVIGIAVVVSGETDNAAAPVIAASGLQVGVAVFGAQAGRAKQKIALGVRTYTDLQLAIEPACVFHFPTNLLHQIEVPDGIARGKVALVEGRGVRFIKESASLVRVDALGDPDLALDCCPYSGEPLRFLNDASPSEAGNIGLNITPFSEPETSDDLRQVIRIKTETGKITFSLSV